MYPTQSTSQIAAFAPHDDDDATIVTSNCNTKYAAADAVIKQLECVNAITIAKSHVIADTGATSIFVTKGTPIKNRRKSDNPITISLPDGS